MKRQMANERLFSQMANASDLAYPGMTLSAPGGQTNA